MGLTLIEAMKHATRVGFRAVNETEVVHLFGGDLDRDRSLVDRNGPEARASRTEQKPRSMRLTLEVAVINGAATRH